MPSQVIPSFIICGAPRSGTTWLLQALDRHPRVYMARPFVPEPKFFHIDKLYAKGMDFYLQNWFAEAPADAVAGEKDTYYLENPHSAARIHAHLPAVKLLFILREPGARAYSNYLWSRQHGHETLSFEEALEQEEERERTLPQELQFVRPHAYLSRGLYVRQLQPYFEHFSQEQFLFLNYEDILEDPQGLLCRTQVFLGLEARPQDTGELGVVNSSQKVPENSMAPQTRAWLDRYFEEPNRELFALLPDFRPWLRKA